MASRPESSYHLPIIGDFSAIRAQVGLNISVYRCRVQNKRGRICGVKYWEIIAKNLNKAGWSLGWVPAVDHQGQTRSWRARGTEAL